MDRLSPLDASFLHIENDVNHMHIASVGIFEGPPPATEEIERLVGGKLPLVPRYRQVVRFVPGQVGRPVWVDDQHFDLRYHVRRTALPSPGGATELRNLTGRVMSQQLDRSKPLWEIWVAEGLEDGHWAMLSKVHHCMVDGIAGTDLLAVILDAEPEPSEPVADDWQPEPPPSDVRLLREALVERLVDPYEQMRGIRAALRRPKRVLEGAREVLEGVAASTPLIRPAPGTSITGDIGPHRRWGWARTTLGEIKAVRQALGGTVNDVVLTAITRGFRDLLVHRGEPVADMRIRTLVPVSVRSPGERGEYNNKVSGMIAELPVGIADPVERLEAVRSQLQDLKESKQAVAAGVLTDLGGFAPPMLLALGTRVGTRLARRLGQPLHTVTTNVPGPQFPLYAGGRRMIEIFPYVPLAAPVRFGIAIFSYDGKMSFGVTGDLDGAPDIDVLTNGIEEGMTELLKAAGA